MYKIAVEFDHPATLTMHELNEICARMVRELVDEHKAVVYKVGWSAK